MTKNERAGFEALARTLRDHFGTDAQADHFLRTFADLVVKFPPGAWVEEQVRTRRFHKALTRDPSTAVVRRLADIHSLELRDVARSFAKTNNGVGLKQLRAEAAARAVGDHYCDEPGETPPASA